MPNSTRFRNLGLVVILGLAVAMAPSVWAADAPTFTVVAASAFLRNEPSTQAPATYSIFRGQVYAIIGRNADSSWLQLEVFKATKGTWVLASLGKVTGDLTSVPITTATSQAGSTATAATSLPVSPAVVEPTPTAAGPSEICVLLYNDANGDGKLDLNEGAIAEGQLTILDTGTGAVVATYTTTPADAHGHCFKDLPAGTYTIAAAAPAGYNATVESSVSQSAQAGERYQIYFGAQPGASTPPPDESARFLTTVLSALGVVLFLFAAGITAAFLLRRKVAGEGSYGTRSAPAYPSPSRPACKSSATTCSPSPGRD